MFESAPSFMALDFTHLSQEVSLNQLRIQIVKAMIIQMMTAPRPLPPAPTGTTLTTIIKNKTNSNTKQSTSPPPMTARTPATNLNDGVSNQSRFFMEDKPRLPVPIIKRLEEQR